MPNLYEQQGGDITASDMVTPEEDSDIKKFYDSSTVLITGATGFLGKLCMEKLLRVCNVRRIYVIIRPKKGKDPQKRFEELFEEPSFDPLKRKLPNFQNKISMIEGDCMLPNLGLAENDKKKLEEEVNCVFHFAATVRFDEKLRIATYINVRATRDIIKLSKKMKNLKCFVHVSTAFSNCYKDRIEEAFYNPPISGEKLITLVDCLDDKRLDSITSSLLGEFPNTYTFTKCVAEDLVKTEGTNIPIILFRPSIVVGTFREPVAGWIDNIYGATGVLLGSAIGLLHSVQGKLENRADIVPADFVINGCLAAAWDVATIKGNNDNIEKMGPEEKTLVYNYVTSPDNPMTWREFERLSYLHGRSVASEKCMWHYFLNFHPSYLRHKFVCFISHTAPAYIVDFALVCLGKKPMMIKAYQKIDKFAEVLSYFTTREWDWANDNVKAVWKRLKPSDKELFDFNMQTLNWDEYFCIYCKGGRVYILKDPLDTIPKGKVKLFKLAVAHYIVVGLLLLILFKFVMFLLGYLF